ncbi:MAG: DUF5655 domain-containing protein [Anaerovoracaceae bacterium]
MSPATEMIYNELCNQIRHIGEFEIEEKKTCLHFSNGRAFVGIHPKLNWLDINIVSDHELKDKRVIKSEQVSKRRFHNQFRLSSRESIDQKLVDFIETAYNLL